MPQSFASSLAVFACKELAAFSSAARHVPDRQRSGKHDLPGRQERHCTKNLVEEGFMLRICAWLLATAAAIAVAPFAGAAGAYPDRPVRLLIPFPPGGGTDVLARALQDKIEAALGAQLIIDNRGGAGGTLGTAVAAKAEPDGYTYLFT
jgi:hypothetical protein